MNNQEIIDNAPEGATHFNEDYVQYLRASKSGYREQDTVNEEWDYGYSNHCRTRSIADVKRIVELEKELNIAESIIIKTANNIIDADNCEQDSDEMNECWDCLKDFALTATGRCDT